MPGYLLQRLLGPDMVSNVVPCDKFIPGLEDRQTALVVIGGQLMAVDMSDCAAPATLATFNIGSPILVATPVDVHKVLVVTDDLEIILCECLPVPEQKVTEEGEEVDENGRWQLALCAKCTIQELPAGPNPLTTPRSATHSSGVLTAFQVISGWLHVVRVKGGRFEVTPMRTNRHIVTHMAFLNAAAGVAQLMVGLDICSPGQFAERQQYIEAYTLPPGQRDLSDTVMKFLIPGNAIKVLPLPERAVAVVCRDCIVHFTKSKDTRKYSLPCIAIDAVMMEDEQHISVLSDTGAIHRILMSNDADAEDLSKCVWDPESFGASNAAVQLSHFHGLLPGGRVIASGKGEWLVIDIAGRASQQPLFREVARGPLTAMMPFTTSSMLLANAKGSLTTVASRYVLEEVAEVELTQATVVGVVTAKWKDGHVVLLTSTSNTRVMFMGEDGLSEIAINGLSTSEPTLALNAVSTSNDEEAVLVQVTPTQVLSSSGISRPVKAAHAAVSPTGAILVGSDSTITVLQYSDSEQSWSTELPGSVAALSISGDGQHLAACLWNPEDMHLFSCQDGTFAPTCVVATDSIARSVLVLGPDRGIVGLSDGRLMGFGFPKPASPETELPQVADPMSTPPSEATPASGSVSPSPSSPKTTDSTPTLRSLCGKQRFSIPPHLSSIGASSRNEILAIGGDEVMLVAKDGAIVSRLHATGTPRAAVAMEIDESLMYVTVSENRLQVLCAAEEPTTLTNRMPVAPGYAVTQVALLAGGIVAAIEPSHLSATAPPSNSNGCFLVEYDRVRFQETARLKLERGEVPLCMTETDASGDALAIVGTGVVQQDGSEPEFGRLLSISSNPLRIQASTVVRGAAVYDVCPFVCPKHPAGFSEMLEGSAVFIANLNRVAVYSVGPTSFTEIASLRTGISAITACALANSCALVGDYHVGPRVYRVDPVVDKPGVVKIAEVAAEHTVTPTTAAVGIGHNDQVLRTDTHRNVFVTNHATKVSTSGTGSTTTSHSLEIEAAIRLNSMVTAVEYADSMSPWQPRLPPTVSANPHFHPPFPIRAGVSARGWMSCMDGSVYVVVGISHELLNILQRVQAEVLQFLGRGVDAGCWRPNKLSAVAAAPLLGFNEQHRVSSPGRRIAMSDSIVSMEIVELFTALNAEAQAEIMKLTQSELPGIDQEAFEKLLTEIVVML